jgi:antitoxin VapB
MNLQIRDERVHELARRLAIKRQMDVTEAIILALENELEREASDDGLPARVAEIAQRLKDMSPGGGRTMTKDEIDAMWGHD